MLRLVFGRLSIERSRPFDEWSTDAVCAWFDEMGLGFYEDDLRKWLKKGAATLANASTQDIEKEISLKSPLHRKKITLAVIEATGRDTDELFVQAGKLDIVWVSQVDAVNVSCSLSHISSSLFSG